MKNVNDSQIKFSYLDELILHGEKENIFWSEQQINTLKKTILKK